MRAPIASGRFADSSMRRFGCTCDDWFWKTPYNYEWQADGARANRARRAVGMCKHGLALLMHFVGQVRFGHKNNATQPTDDLHYCCREHPRSRRRLVGGSRFSDLALSRTRASMTSR